MFKFFQTFQPDPIFFSFYFIHVYWYGLFTVIAILSGILVAWKTGLILNKYNFYIFQEKLKSKALLDKILDLAFYLIIFGYIGARLYDCALNFNYYFNQPLEILAIWNGGLAIHGGIIGAFLGLLVFIKKTKQKTDLRSVLIFISWLIPSLVLGQAIGRWGNYFNQELFGAPTKLPWGIYINPENRPLYLLESNFFHPTFFYESIGDFIIFLILIFYFLKFFRKNPKKYFYQPFFLYLIFYSFLRFSLEFLRIDPTPMIGVWRLPQIVSVLIIGLVLNMWVIFKKKF